MLSKKVGTEYAYVTVAVVQVKSKSLVQRPKKYEPIIIYLIIIEFV